MTERRVILASDVAKALRALDASRHVLVPELTSEPRTLFGLPMVVDYNMPLGHVVVLEAPRPEPVSVRFLDDVDPSLPYRVRYDVTPNVRSMIEARLWVGNEWPTSPKVRPLTWPERVELRVRRVVERLVGALDAAQWMFDRHRRRAELGMRPSGAWTPWVDLGAPARDRTVCCSVRITPR